MPDRRALRLALCGDVMLGRGIDQILAHPGDPELRERSVTDARRYVRLAEEIHGPIPQPVEDSWPWGELLPLLERLTPDLRVLNLETSVTRSGRFAPGKAVHYRMHPDNLGALAAVRPDVCTLANNHVLDLGVEGLTETLDVLDAANLATAGAGRDADAAWSPAVVEGGRGGRVLILALGAPTSGIPASWAATPHRPGIAVLGTRLTDDLPGVLRRIDAVRREGDVVIVSIHWGSNWGYDVPRAHARFARALIDGGVDVVHGHSSHHPRPLEVYRDRLILYGCGDLINDYEGIGGHAAYRADLRLLFVVDLDPATGALSGLRLIPLRARRFRLEAADREEAQWLCATLSAHSRSFGVALTRDTQGHLTLA